MSATDGELYGTPSDVTITVLDSYASWAVRSGVGAEGNDEDGDGYTDLEEYGLDTNPSVAGSAGQPATTLDPDGHLTITFLRARAELNYSIETSDDLVIWNPFVTNPGNIGEMVTVTYNPFQAGDKTFLRLRIGRP